MSNAENDEANAQKWRDAVRQQQADKAEQAKAAKARNEANNTQRNEAKNAQRSAKPPARLQDPHPAQAPAHDGNKSRRQPRKRHRAPAPEPVSGSEDSTTEEDQGSHYDLTSSDGDLIL